MLLIVCIFGTAFLWLAIQAEDEILVNGLPQNCGTRPSFPLPRTEDARGKTEAPAHSWPWQVALYSSFYGPYPFGGGTLIAPTWVLTVAHAFPGTFRCKNLTLPPLGRPFDHNSLTDATLAVRIGSHNYKNESVGAHNIIVKHVIMHPSFPGTGPKTGFDFALLKLEREVKRSQQVGFACLPKPGLTFNDRKTCYVAGWGFIPLQRTVVPSEVLMEQSAVISKRPPCALAYPNSFSANHICVKQTYGTWCVGDSGGAVNCLTKEGKWTVYGVTSVVEQGCGNGYGLAASTDTALEWIKQMIQNFN